MRRVLLVSYYFPPRFSIGGKRAHRFARYLPEHGFAPTVLTARGPASERLDPSLDGSLEAMDVRRDYLTPREVAGLEGRMLGSDGTIAAPTKAWSPDRGGLRGVLSKLSPAWPVGASAPRLPMLARRIARVAREARSEVIFATGSPWETVVAGVIAGKLLGIPVVVDFRDPWSFGPVAERRPLVAGWADAQIERLVLRSAAALTVTTRATRARYVELRSAKRVELIRNGYDPALAPEPAPSEHASIVHFGNCYGERNLAPFIRALANVAKRRGLGPKDVSLINLGRVAEEDLALAASLGIGEHFRHQTVLPYAEGMRVVAGADLAILPSFGGSQWFLPGKLYDYLLARVPVLAVSDSPELEELLTATGLGTMCGAEDEAGLVRGIEAALNARAEGRRLGRPNEVALEALSARNTAAELARLLEDVLSP